MLDRGRLLVGTLLCLCVVSAEPQRARGAEPQPLPGTQPLTIAQPLDEYMVDGIDRFALREIAASVARRQAYWKPDYSSAAAYDQSVAANRDRFRTIVGAVDPRIEAAGLEWLTTSLKPAEVAAGKDYTIRSVRWPVLQGITAEGLLLQPQGPARALIVALPDADWTPEMLAGIASGLDPREQLARRLVEQGCSVLVPTLISRADTFSGNPEVLMLNQPHREFIYRQAFEMGRHVIGYEVQKVLAAVDQFTLMNTQAKADLPIGVAGIGEGGLLALYSAALDTRIDAALVSGYFQPREQLWTEPIYRNVWALLQEFGDAELAGLVAPRGLVIEAARAPEVAGPPAPREGRGAGAAPGAIVTPVLANVQREAGRAQPVFDKLKVADKLQLITSGDTGTGPAGTDAALTALLKTLGLGAALQPSGDAPKLLREADASEPRQQRQFQELIDFTQRLVRRSAKARDQFWNKADRSSVDAWTKSAEPYRQHVYEELIGKLPDPTMEPNVRTRLVLDEPQFRGYEVVIDVYPDVIAAGILLLPRDLKPGEKRPVVVCQHGLEGVPMDTITRQGTGFQYYSAFAAELAARGFITYAPQNPYRGRDRFRTLQRKSNPMKRSLFTYIIPQHERTLEFLATLPNVDPQRIAFYGLSYGGKTAVRVPPLLSGYCLSICSADYNEWIVKNTSMDTRTSYMFTGEYEIYEWNMGHVANYAELANLMTPRPFMVERGHNDGVAPDEWVAWEFAKVRRHYTQIGLADKAEIEFFNGPHKINGVATYKFLHKHLNWPEPAAK